MIGNNQEMSEVLRCVLSCINERTLTTLLARVIHQVDNDINIVSVFQPSSKSALQVGIIGIAPIYRLFVILAIGHQYSFTIPLYNTLSDFFNSCVGVPPQ